MTKYLSELGISKDLNFSHQAFWGITFLALGPLILFAETADAKKILKKIFHRKKELEFDNEILVRDEVEITGVGLETGIWTTFRIRLQNSSGKALENVSLQLVDIHYEKGGSVADTLISQIPYSLPLFRVWTESQNIQQ